VLAVELTPAAAADPVFGPLPSSFATLQWHGETYELPPGAVQLARSELYEQQAFVVGRAYALQFHLEVDAELTGEWMRTPAFVAELERDQGADAPAALLAKMQDVERDEPELYAAWRRGGAAFRFPGGESLLEHQQRVTEALAEIHATGPLPALVVCHGGSIRVMLCAADPRGLDAFHTFEVPNVAVVPL